MTAQQLDMTMRDAEVSNAELAKEIGLSRSTIGNFRSGHRAVPEDRAPELWLAIARIKAKRAQAAATQVFNPIAASIRAVVTNGV